MENSLSFFPIPLPDETLHSVLSRCCRLAGCVTFDTMLGVRCGRLPYARATAFPCGLGELTQRIATDSPYSTEYLISRHTQLAYFRPFISFAQFEIASAQMASGSSSNLDMKLGVVSSTLEQFQRVRYCRICLQSDECCYGQAYWHRVHQLPGVWVCPVHAQLLDVVDARWSKVHASRPYLPDSEGVRQNSCRPVVGQHKMPGVLNLALLSQSVLEAEIGPIAPERMRRVLLAGCAHLGLYERRLHLRSLAAAITSHLEGLPDAGEFRALSSPNAIEPPVWAMKLLRKPRSTHHPLKYLLLMQTLDVEFSQVCCAEEPDNSGPHEAYHPCDLAVGGHASDQFDTTQYSLRQLAALSGLALNTVKERASQQGYAIRERPRTLTPSVKGSINCMAISGASVASIAHNLSISLPSVYRTLRLNLEIKKCRSDLLFELERDRRRLEFARQLETTGLRKCSDYSWLNRHDRSWLSVVVQQSHPTSVRRSSRVDWGQRDRLLSELIPKCALSIRNRPGKPKRVSIAMIGRELAATDLLEKHLHHLPLCKAVLMKEKEGASEFLERRMRWAAEQILKCGDTLLPSRLQRLAGLRARTAAFECVRAKLLAEQEKMN